LGGLTASLLSIFYYVDVMYNYDYDIVESRYGLYTSVLKDGTKMTTALTEEACRYVTDNIRIPVMKGVFDGWTSIMGKASVDGKL
tara:strand:+ start:250 stop:504 length:255 start_codon:yes stop_codon:yes gene_type:complete